MPPSSLYDRANPGDYIIVCISRGQVLHRGDLAAELGDDVIEILLRAETLPFEQLHNGENLPHIGTRKQGHSEFHAVASGGGLREWRSPEARGADEIRPGP